MTITHRKVHVARRSRPATREIAARAFYGLRALSERRQAAKYRATFGADAYRGRDLEALWSQSASAVSKRSRSVA